METHRVEFFKHSTRLQVRIDMPDGTVYGIECPANTEHDEVIKLVDELVQNPKSRRVLDLAGGINLVKGGPHQKVRIYKERSK
jgi:hypothetical protein